MAYLREDVSLYCLFSARGATEDGRGVYGGGSGWGWGVLHLVKITESFVEFKKRSGHIALRCL